MGNIEKSDIEKVDDFLLNGTDELEELQLENTNNIFDILKCDKAELKHSNFLAWLFDAKQGHGLGNKFLKNFIKKLKEKNKDRIQNVSLFENYKVETEVKTETKKGRIDILISSKEEKFVICIENKIESKESTNGENETQLNKYRKYVQKEFPKSEGYKQLFIYLTALNETPSDEKNWIATDYECIVKVLEEILDNVISDNAKIFINSYIEILKRNYVEDELFIKKCQDIYEKYYKAWEIIQSNVTISDDMKEISDYIKKYLQDTQERVEITYESSRYLCFNTEEMRNKFGKDIYWQIIFDRINNCIFVNKGMDASKETEEGQKRMLKSWQRYVDPKATLGESKTKTITKDRQTIQIVDENIEDAKSKLKRIIDDTLKEKWEEKN